MSRVRRDIADRIAILTLFGGFVAVGARGQAALTLASDAACYGTGATMTVRIELSGSPENIVGGQFFLSYQAAHLDFVSASAGDAAESDPLNPFEREVIELVNETAGTIDFAVGVPDGVAGAASGVMAVLTFTTTTEICGASGLVGFRTSIPPTRIVDVNDTGYQAGDGSLILNDLLPISIDGTPPMLACPDDVNVPCNADVPAANVEIVMVNDSCDPAPLVEHVGDMGNGGAGCAASPLVITRTYRATDGCGNSQTCTQIITVIDATAPIAICQDIALPLDNAGSATLIASQIDAGSSDNCSSIVLSVDPASFTCADVGPNAVTLTVTDSCGNSSTCEATVTIVDDEPPTIVCPPDIQIHADAGGCTADGANVALGSPITADNCGIASVTNDAPMIFPPGSTIITWTVMDVNGNSANCEQTVTVSEFNELSVTIELAATIDTGASPDVLTRCITLELFDCPGAMPVVSNVEVNFAVQVGTPTIGTATVLIPCGSYTCITARDRLHTLRRTDDDDFGIDGTQYVADFTTLGSADDDALVGGNLNDDDFIDILDFGIFVNRFGAMYDGDLDAVADGNTPCGYVPAPLGPFHADVSGNGHVDTADFTFIQIHFLRPRDPNCCELPGVTPVTSITTLELHQMGLHELIRADLTGDGVLDIFDVVAFANGARPARLRPVTHFAAGSSAAGGTADAQKHGDPASDATHP